MKTHDFDAYLTRHLKKPQFRAAYEDLADEYDLAAQIIRFRIRQKLTQAQLAQVVGTSQPAIARLESGNHRNVTLSFLFRVARALDLEPQLKFRKRSRVRPPDRRDSRKRAELSSKLAGR